MQVTAIATITKEKILHSAELNLPLNHYMVQAASILNNLGILLNHFPSHAESVVTILCTNHS